MSSMNPGLDAGLNSALLPTTLQSVGAGSTPGDGTPDQLFAAAVVAATECLVQTMTANLGLTSEVKTTAESNVPPVPGGHEPLLRPFWGLGTSTLDAADGTEVGIEAGAAATANASADATAGTAVETSNDLVTPDETGRSDEAETALPLVTTPATAPPEVASQARTSASGDAPTAVAGNGSRGAASPIATQTAPEPSVAASTALSASEVPASEAETPSTPTGADVAATPARSAEPAREDGAHLDTPQPDTTRPDAARPEPTRSATPPAEAGGPVDISMTAAATVGRSPAAEGAPRQTVSASQLWTQVVEQAEPALIRLRTLSEGSHTMRITLNPEHLGPVRLVAQMHQGHLELTVHAATEAARSLLQEGIPELRAEFSRNQSTVNVNVQTETGGHAFDRPDQEHPETSPRVTPDPTAGAGPAPDVPSQTVPDPDISPAGVHRVDLLT